jgi:hypothetical protein
MGFANDIIGGAATLIRAAVQSANFVSNVSGWQITKNGDAQFNNLTIRGSFNGNDFIINSAGIFIYSGTPAFGNLIISIASSIGSDSFGNPYDADLVVYGPGASYVQIADGVINFQATASQSSPAQIETASIAGLLELSSGTVTGADSPALIDLLSASANGGQSAVDLSSSDLVQIGAGLPTGYPVSLDPNSGSTWVSGERAFINTWPTCLNSLIANLSAKGIL